MCLAWNVPLCFFKKIISSYNMKTYWFPLQSCCSYYSWIIYCVQSMGNTSTYSMFIVVIVFVSIHHSVSNKCSSFCRLPPILRGTRQKFNPYFLIPLISPLCCLFLSYNSYRWMWNWTEYIISWNHLKGISKYIQVSYAARHKEDTRYEDKR